MNQARVTVVVVTYNSSAVVRPCLAALVDDPRIDVVVHDNSSTDGTPDLIANEFPTVRLTRGETNDGFARAVNHAAATLSSSILLLLNPDAVISRDSVMALCDAVDAAPDTICSPMVIDPAGHSNIAGAGRFPTAVAMFAHYSGLSRVANRHKGLAGHYLTTRQADRGEDMIAVDWVSGACMAMRSERWDQLGGLSERWFMYAEDIELCWRAAHLDGDGLRGDRLSRCRLITSVQATHLVGQSSPRGRKPARGSRLGRSAWIVNLYDFYCSSMASNRLECVLWGVTTAGGLLLRASVFALQAMSRPGSRRTHLARSVAFLHHAADVLCRVPSATPSGARSDRKLVS